MDRIDKALEQLGPLDTRAKQRAAEKGIARKIRTLGRAPGAVCVTCGQPAAVYAAPLSGPKPSRDEMDRQTAKAEPRCARCFAYRMTRR